MLIPDYVNIDYDGPFPELCEQLAHGAGLQTRKHGKQWDSGAIVVRGLNGDNAPELAGQHTRTPGPMVVVVSPDDLATMVVAEAAGMTDAYTLTNDPPAVFRASLISATRRWDTERMLAETLEERDMLLRELGHRIKNTLSLTSSLLSLAQARVANEQDAGLFEDSRARVQAMAVLYDRLLHSPSQSHIDLGYYLSGLCSSLADAYTGGQGLSLSVDVNGIETDSRKAVSLGLAVNEAVTNAIKYAGRAGRSPFIRVTGAVQDGGQSFSLTVADDGAGLPKGYDWQHSDGLGFVLIRSLTEQLGGRLRVESSPRGGTSIHIEGLR